MVNYTDKQKAAYYKKKAQMVAAPRKRAGPYRPQPKKKAYNKNHSKYNYPGVGRYLGSMAGSAIGNAIMPGAGGAIGGALEQ